MTKKLKVTPVDPIALRGLTSHAESHWLTFATAMRCYAQQPTKPDLAAAADRHGPTWLRNALRGEKKPRRPRPREFEASGSLAYLTRGAEEALKKPEPRQQPELEHSRPFLPSSEALRPTLRDRS